jgi:hypothetical protein
MNPAPDPDGAASHLWGSTTTESASQRPLFRAVLGTRTHVERTDHILACASRCAYSITPIYAGTGRQTRHRTSDSGYNQDLATQITVRR